MRRARPLLLALLVICSLLALRRPRGIVLCIEADGPIAFEPVYNSSPFIPLRLLSGQGRDAPCAGPGAIAGTPALCQS
jgi:hypothetical protein